MPTTAYSFCAQTAGWLGSTLSLVYGHIRCPDISDSYSLQDKQLYIFDPKALYHIMVKVGGGVGGLICFTSLTTNAGSTSL